MLHRFTDPATGTVGQEPAALRQTLSFLRRRGYEPVELGEMFRRLSDYDIRFLTPGAAGRAGRGGRGRRRVHRRRLDRHSGRQRWNGDHALRP